MQESKTVNNPIILLASTFTHMYSTVYFLPILGLLVLIYAAWRASWIKSQDAGEEKMTEIAHHIAQGATSFLQAAYKSIILFVGLTCLGLLILGSTVTSHTHPLIAITFLLGALTSATAGWMHRQHGPLSGGRHAARLQFLRRFQ
ncbi:MAG: sodium/proton-translocating pyrophosphatase [Bacteroidota bacterium]